MTLTVALWTEYIRQVRSAAVRSRWRQKKTEGLILAHLKMVEPIARKVARRFSSKLDIRDFVQAGRVGLCEAAQRYRPRDGSFERFAYQRVRGAMIDAHKRKAYREELHESVEGMEERLGYLPARVATDPAPLPDAVAAEKQAYGRVVEIAIRRLPDEELAVFGETLAGQDLHQIAAAHGRSLTWARTKLSAARVKVAAALRNRAA